jgi:hypothetical protein
MCATNSKKNSHASKIYRVRILAPDSTTKWLPPESLALEVEEMTDKPVRKKQRGGHVVISKPPAAAA